MSSQIPPNNGIVQGPQAVIVNPPMAHNEAPEFQNQKQEQQPDSDSTALNMAIRSDSGLPEMTPQTEFDAESEFPGIEPLEVNDYTIAP